MYSVGGNATGVHYDGRNQQQPGPGLLQNPTITVDTSDDDDDEIDDHHMNQYNNDIYGDEYHPQLQQHEQSMSRHHRGRDVHNKCCNNRVWCVRVNNYAHFMIIS